MSLRITAARSAIWAGVESASLSLFSFLVLLVLAKLLTPSDFGVAAISLSLIQLLSAVGELLFHDAIVRRKEISAEQIAAAHTTTVVLGGFLMLAIMAGAPLLERLFHARNLAPVLFWMAPSIMLVAAGAVPVAVLRRHMKFRIVALRMLCGRLAGGMVGIIAASVGFGVWSLVAQQVVMPLVALLAIVAFDPTSLPGFTNPKSATVLLRFGVPTLVVNLLAGGTVKLFLIVCGFILSTPDLGLVSLALRIVDTLGAIIFGAQSKVALSLFSQVYNEAGSVRVQYLAASRLSACIIVPVFAGLAASAHDAVLVIAGPQWIDIVPLIQIIACAQIFTSLVFLRGAMLTAAGRPGINLITGCADVIAVVAFMLLLGHYGVIWAASAWALRLVVSVPLGLILLARYAGLSFLDILTSSYQALIAAVPLVMAIGASDTLFASAPLLLRIATSVLAGAISYLGTLWFLNPQVFREFQLLFVGVFSKDQIDNGLADPRA